LAIDQVEAGFGQLQTTDHGLRVKTAQHDANGQGGILVGLRRHLDSINKNFIGIAVSGGQRDHIDLHAVLAGDACLLLRLANVFIAVTDEHDALSGPLGKGCQRQLDGGGDVRVGIIDGAIDFFETEFRNARGGQFQTRPATEDDHSGAIPLLGPLANRFIDEIHDPLFAEVFVPFSVLFGRNAQGAVPGKEYRHVFVLLTCMCFG
jgi:hypothetical protein